MTARSGPAAAFTARVRPALSARLAPAAATPCEALRHTAEPIDPTRAYMPTRENAPSAKRHGGPTPDRRKLPLPAGHCAPAATGRFHLSELMFSRRTALGGPDGAD